MFWSYLNAKSFLESANVIKIKKVIKNLVIFRDLKRVRSKFLGIEIVSP